jgi:hypothetical protein
MTLALILSIVTTVAIVGFLLVVLTEHVFRHDKVEKLQRETDDEASEAITASEAGFDWRRAA